MARNRKSKRMRSAAKRESGKRHGRKEARRTWDMKMMPDGTEKKVRI